MIITQGVDLQIPHTDLPGMRGRARGFRLRVRNAKGELEEVYDLRQRPTLEQIRRVLRPGCAAELDQAVYTIGNKRRRVYALIARYFAIHDDKVRMVADRIAKAQDINTPPGVQVFVDNMTADILEAVESKNEAGLRAAMRTIERNKAMITPAQHAELARLISGNWAKAVQGIENIPALHLAMRNGGLAAVEASRLSMAEQFGFRKAIELAPNATDEHVIDLMAEQRSFYVQDAFGIREGRTARKAQSIMGAALKEGLGREAIAPMLQRELGDYMGREDLNYWTTVSDNFTSRARNLGNMTSMSDAGFETFTVEAVLDEATTDICRFMHGQTISIPAAVNIMEAAEQHPRGLDKFNPFIQSRTRGGVTTLQVPHTTVHPKTGRQSMSLRTLATSKSTGMGRPDATGVWSSKIKPGDLEASNVGGPPYHHRCRTTIIPTPSVGAGGIVPPKPPPKAKPVPRIVPPPPPPKPMEGKPRAELRTAFDPEVPTIAASEFNRFNTPTTGAQDQMLNYWGERQGLEQADFNTWVDMQRKAGLDPARRDQFREMAHKFVRDNGKGKRKGFFKMEYGTKARRDAQNVQRNHVGFGAMGEKGKAGALDRQLREEAFNGINDLADYSSLNKHTGGIEHRVMMFRQTRAGASGSHGGPDVDVRNPDRRVHLLAVRKFNKRYPGQNWDGRDAAETSVVKTGAHEMGHVIDHTNKNASALAHGILRKRIEANPRKLIRRTETGKLAYYYHPDVQSISEYATAQYSRFAPGVEFVSENLAEFWMDPMRLYEIDREAFHMITALLRGM